VEDGSKIRFRHDVRCGDHTLKAAFPLLFSIGYNKEACLVLFPLPPSQNQGRTRLFWAVLAI
jgi:hypothetical protein